jgi:hypothetical protein
VRAVQVGVQDLRGAESGHPVHRRQFPREPAAGGRVAAEPRLEELDRDRVAGRAGGEVDHALAAFAQPSGQCVIPEAGGVLYLQWQRIGHWTPM